MAKRLSYIDDKWEILGSYLNINKDTLIQLHVIHKKGKTSSKIYTMFKIWRDNIPDASLSQLQHIVSEFESQQPMLARSSSSSSAYSLGEWLHIRHANERNIQG